jgi:hypothetical protein
MNILIVRKTKILNFKNSRSLLSFFFVRAARALLCPSSLELRGGALELAYMTAKIVEYFLILAKY